MPGSYSRFNGWPSLVLTQVTMRENVRRSSGTSSILWASLPFSASLPSSDSLRFCSATNPMSESVNSVLRKDSNSSTGSTRRTRRR